MTIQILTAFPGAFDSVFSQSIIKRAIESEVVKLEIHDLRRFARDKHNRLDDTPFGGGPGMVMKPEPLFRAMEFLLTGLDYKPKTVLMSPQGTTFNQAAADALAELSHIILICGHYKGVDQRFIDEYVEEELSIGDYILTGGEIPAMVVVDSVVRLLPEAISDIESAMTDSFRDGLLEGPVYTRPENFRGLKVPEILLSGHHSKIAEWRRQQAIKTTQTKRPDLLTDN
ncbi:MAG: tRNA (guanosine(37)-N1)-methyltransferase TrmD [candidate division Zixibacteria bacterium]|nr:tRNA (guanosine(37)-N1)-methyltransferase TrmD [Candidatus Tariuqbacter arcticus]